MRPCEKNNQDGPEGLDLVGGKKLSLTECKNLCSGTPTCNALAWNELAEICHIKKKQNVCNDKPCQWNYPSGSDEYWNWYWKTCEGLIFLDSISIKTKNIYVLNPIIYLVRSFIRNILKELHA